MPSNLKKAMLDRFLDPESGGTNFSEALSMKGCWNTAPNIPILVEYPCDTFNVEDPIEDFAASLLLDGAPTFILTTMTFVRAVSRDHNIDYYWMTKWCRISLH